MTFVVEFEDGKEPAIQFTENFLGSGGRLCSVSVFDYKDDFFSAEQRDAISEIFEASEFDDRIEESVAEEIMRKVELLTY